MGWAGPVEDDTEIFDTSDNDPDIGQDDMTVAALSDGASAAFLTHLGNMLTLPHNILSKCKSTRHVIYIIKVKG